MLRHLQSIQARRQLLEIVEWLNNPIYKDGDEVETLSINRGIHEIPVGSVLFRLTRAINEDNARDILGIRPTFFATTEDEANRYLEFANKGQPGDLVMIRATSTEVIRVASVDQKTLTEAIYVGVRTPNGTIGPFEYLYPPEDDLPIGLSDSDSIRIQRWIVPKIISIAINRKFDALERTGVPEMNVLSPLLGFEFEFEWR